MHAEAVTFRDLEFHYEFRWITSSDGRITRRWVPVGMPLLSHGMERCVFFAFGKNYGADTYHGPHGTGFFVSRMSKALPYTFHFYAITNRHVALQSPCIRINSGELSVQYWDYEPTDWACSVTDDLAAVDITDQIEFSEERGIYNAPVNFVSEDYFVSDWFKRGYSVGIGDQTVMLGLLSHHNGGKINLPVGRFGNISAVPNDLMPVRLNPQDSFVRPAWLERLPIAVWFLWFPCVGMA